jgi:uncharacterized protein (TIGR00725 family)
MPAQKKVIAVIGAGQPAPGEARLAEEIGRELARRGHILVCGGMGGTMEAACRGAQALGGLTIGILPGEKRDGANAFVDIPIVTGIGHARNLAVVRSAHAVIAIGGNYGTLSEISFALQAGIPVVGLNTWAIMRHNQPDAGIIPADNAVEAVDKAVNAAIL